MADKIFLTGKGYQQQLRFRETYFSGFEDGFLFRQHSAGEANGITGKHAMVLPEKETASILQLVQADESGLYVCILAALGIVLRTYAQQENIMIDSPPLLTGKAAGGEYTPVCLTVQENLSIRSYLNNITHTLKEVYAQQAVLAPAANEWTPPRSNILLQNPAIHVAAEDVRHDLIISIHQTNGVITLAASYDERAFTASFIRDLLIHVSRVITHYGKLDTPLKEIAILSEPERDNILSAFNNTARPVPEGATVVSLFEEQAANHPDAIAVEYGDTRLTYAVLNEKANILAHHLLHHYHICANDIIGLMAPPSDSWLIAMLGILKAGAAFLPVDTDLPEERKKFLLTNAGVKLLLTDTVEFLQLHYYEESVFLLDSNLQPLAAEVQPLHRNDVSQLAYVIYTSGTTGLPKGVLLGHGGLVNMVLDQVKQFGIRPSDKVLQFSSVSFDAAISEIGMAICSGAQLVMMDRKVIKDDLLFLEILKEKGITVLTLPPSYLSVIPWSEFTFLRVIISAGEKLHTTAALYLSEQVNFFNAYGPTECTVCTTINRIRPEMTKEEAESIGAPIANMEVYILGANGEVLPVGVTGHIYIGGAGVAKGYLHLPALNHEKFIPHPFSAVAGAKLYHTGDMGKWLPDGKIVFHGRCDDQVKVRGFRIELGEIAAIVMQSGLVKHCEVLVKEDTGGSKKIMAFVVADENFEQGKITTYLLSRLPQYMLPAVWVRIATLPLTNNGKVDKKKLLEMEATPAKNDAAIAPANEVEVKLADIWKEVLALEEVGVTDDFFSIGGDSLLAIRVVAAVRDGFSLNISINTLFSYTTIRQLADYITVAGDNENSGEDQAAELLLL
jgi:amino acid adenylation domain-containing protein